METENALQIQNKFIEFPCCASNCATPQQLVEQLLNKIARGQSDYKLAHSWMNYTISMFESDGDVELRHIKVNGMQFISPVTWNQWLLDEVKKLSQEYNNIINEKEHQ